MYIYTKWYSPLWCRLGCAIYYAGCSFDVGVVESCVEAVCGGLVELEVEEVASHVCVDQGGARSLMIVGRKTLV